jgi:hypothetical protein
MHKILAICGKMNPISQIMIQVQHITLFLNENSIRMHQINMKIRLYRAAIDA